jgi:DNA-binding NtrC family response regulator
MKPRLLIVDDEQGVCDLLAVYFEHRGLEVVTAQSDAAARFLLRQNRFDLVIVDWNLSGSGDGLDLLGYIQVMHPGLPAVVYTGVPDSENLLAQALADKAEAVIRKNGPLAALAREVDRIILGPKPPAS